MNKRPIQPAANPERLATKRAVANARKKLTQTPNPTDPVLVLAGLVAIITLGIAASMIGF